MLDAFPAEWDPLHRADLKKRLADDLPGAQDALAVTMDGGHLLACGWISKRYDLGILNRLATRPEHRGRGHARRLVEALLAWFDMTGGKWLYATAPADLGERLFSRFGFKALRRATRSPQDVVVLLRTAPGVPEDPLLTADGKVTVHEVARVNWPSMVVLLHNRAGPDPRVGLNESAVSAERMTLELIEQAEAGRCHLKAAFHGFRLVGLATLALDRQTERTFAVIMPHDEAPAVLRTAVIDFARSLGYARVDFPMEALELGEVRVATSAAGGPTSAAEPERLSESPASDAPA